MLTLGFVHGTVFKCLPGDVFMELYPNANLGMCGYGTVSKCYSLDVFMELNLSANLGMCSWNCI